jgi:mono/diheme cytochrome c family protein
MKPLGVPQMSMSQRSWSVPAAIAALALAGAAMAFEAVTLEDYSGEELYLRFCASCHGSEAMGDGPVSRSLNVAVPDLTRIRSRYGEFPAGLIRDIIDGRGIDKRAHGTREMPVWGYEFWVEEGGDVTAQKTVRDAINKLVEHLRSIQRGDDELRAPGSAARQ